MTKEKDTKGKAKSKTTKCGEMNVDTSENENLSEEVLLSKN